MFRVRKLSALARRYGGGFALACAFAGCAANCLRDSDCDDAHVCRHDRCELPGSSASDAAPSDAGQAGAVATSTSSAGAGGSASGSGGSGGSASATDISSGGSATGGRENLDASGD